MDSVILQQLLMEAVQLVISAETVDIDIQAGGKVYRTKFCPYCKSQAGHSPDCGFIELLDKLRSNKDTIKN